MRPFYITTILLLLLYLPNSYAAEEAKDTTEKTKDVFLGVGLWTRHISPGKKTNEDSDLVVAGYDSWLAARFINSYHNESYFAGKLLYAKEIKPFPAPGLFLRGNLYGGIIYGYKKIINVARFTPAIFPSASLGLHINKKNEVGLEILYIPTDKGGLFSNYVTYRYRF